MLAHVAQTLTFLMTGHAFRAHCFVDLRRSGRLRRMPTLYLATDPAADELLATDPLALLIGMLLDQQIPLEKAFSSPYVLTQRLGVTRRPFLAEVGAYKKQLKAGAKAGP